MEVTHREDKVTHAVITAHRAMDVQLSDDATFLHTLTATLYSNQKGAVVREIICNAWDAHKVSERTHLPIVVTLTHESMTFKDSGLGIPPGMEMLKIYGTYGGSTKRNDGKQTGGFGLGSKAPWAYSDQFTVISCHKGTKTIYNMSKSSAEVAGKPSIIPIASMPTEEEGVTVVVPIKEADYVTFGQLIKKFTLYGDMNVQLNDTELPTIPFNSVQETYVASPEINSTGFPDRILVRYGDVIYPLGSKHEMFVDEHRTATQILSKFGPNWRLVLLAEPNTISVTPSRESLSMQLHTATTVKRLLENFIFKTNSSPEARNMENKILLDGLKKVSIDQKIPGLLEMSKQVPGVENVSHIVLAQKIVHDPEVLTKVALKRYYPRNKDFRKLDIKTRLDHLVEQGIGNPGLIRTFMQLWERCNSSVYTPDLAIQEWFQRRIVGQVRRKINKSQTMKESRLFVVGHVHEYNCTMWNYRAVDDRTTKAAEADVLSIEEYIPYLRNIVVLSYTKNDVLKQFLKQEAIIKKYGKFAKFVLYTVPRSPKAVDEARALFKTLNANFVDLTQGIDIKPQKKSINPANPKPVKKEPGLPLLSEAYDPALNPNLQMNKLLLSSAKRTEIPEFYVHTPVWHIRGLPHRISQYIWTLGVGKDLISLFGSKGVLATTTTQVSKLEEGGVPSIEQYVISKVTAEITSNPIYKDYAANNIETMESIVKEEVWRDVCSMLKYKSIQKEFGVFVELTEQQQAYVRIANTILGYYTDNGPEVQSLRKVFCDVPPSKAMSKLIQTVNKSSMLHWVDVPEVALTIAGKDQQKSLVALSLLKHALKG